MTVGELGRRMTSAEFSEWLAFNGEYGLPDGFHVAAYLGPAIAAPWSRGKPPGPETFAPYYTRHAQTPEQMLAVFSAFARAQNARLEGGA